MVRQVGADGKATRVQVDSRKLFYRCRCFSDRRSRTIAVKGAISIMQPSVTLSSLRQRAACVYCAQECRHVVKALVKAPSLPRSEDISDEGTSESTVKSERPWYVQNYYSRGCVHGRSRGPDIAGAFKFLTWISANFLLTWRLVLTV